MDSTESHENIELSKKDRLILINQFKILQKLYPDESETYANYQKALEYGYTYNYKWMFESVFDDMSLDLCKEVWDILEMYRSITDSLKKANNNEIKNLPMARFKGFDGNNETDLFTYTRYIIIDLDRYNELKYGKKNPDLNSHMPMYKKYKKMLSLWKSFENKYELNEQQLSELLKC